MNIPSSPTSPMQSSPSNHSLDTIRARDAEYVVPSYGRFDLAFARGAGCELWDVKGKRYLDMGAGIAVCCLGHAHPELAEALSAQAHTLWHTSNLYHQELQSQLAENLSRRIAPGKIFFSNSGAEANEGLFKLARKFGHTEGRFEILTAFNSFHGRTMAGIAATGQEKVKRGFEPLMPGFRHVPFNDLDAVEQALSPATVAVMIEGIQGEGGIYPASPDYLLGLRNLCNKHRLLLFMDGVQCGHFRTGRFQSYQRILEGIPAENGFLPDAISMAKSLGGGFPMGAFWVRHSYGDLLEPGSHGTTFGGAPLACSVALKVLEIIDREHLHENAREVGRVLQQELQRLKTKHPSLVQEVRGIGLMLGLELMEGIPALTRPGSGHSASHQMALRLHQSGLLAIVAGTRTLRLLPPLNLARTQVQEAVAILESTLDQISMES